MNKTISLCLLISISTSLLIISLCAPWVLSDKNTFLSGFINQELLAFLGITVTITLASGANLHLELNRMEEKINKSVFTKSRIAIHQSCYALIYLIASAFFLVLIKPLLPGGDIARSFANSFGIIIVAINIVILFDITAMIFSIPSNTDQ
ncbi:hypothetical protein [Wolbachia endosymbiont of Drosophila subpulchrella]|uniref:hypothetical protein n=1 Tax=Wolbachia endosymbiont of Drosophila subpulchrella TaxID=2033655 RepID=UPI000BB10D8A|nr:hypothetical protein [Wolbachia endosymbiont of Drosophila subpulchrella]